MAAFEKGEVEQSIALFDAAEEADPRYATRLWQRGLSFYYADRFADARKQFLMDVAENPNDTEEAAWHRLAMARSESLAAARPNMIKVGRDPRWVMRTVEEAFRNGNAESVAALEAIANDGSAGDRFYASLYRGLLAEAAGQPRVSADWIAKAVDNREYAQSGDYMYALARVHQSRRKLLLLLFAGRALRELVVLGGLERDVDLPLLVLRERGRGSARLQRRDGLLEPLPHGQRRRLVPHPLLEGLTAVPVALPPVGVGVDALRGVVRRGHELVAGEVGCRDVRLEFRVGLAGGF